MAVPPAQRRILVTGGTGTLGRHAVAALMERPGVAVRTLSRRPCPPDASPDLEWAQADLLRDPLESALAGVDAVLHLASEKGAGDVAQAARLVAAAAACGVRHLVAVSIVGCDRIPLPFYEVKRRVEAAVRAGGVPWTVVRVTQFHSFVDKLIAGAAALPIPAPIFAEMRFQPVDEAEAARHVVEVALGPPRGQAPDLAGPELLTLGAMAATWREATGRHALLVPAEPVSVSAQHPLAPPPWARAVVDGYRAAWNAPQADRVLGQVTFSEWLRARDSGAVPPSR